MSAPTYTLFVTPQGNTWTITLSTIAALDTLVFNGTTFTAETSGATGDQFNIAVTPVNDLETAVNLATALNASSNVNTAISAISKGPWSLDLTTIADADTIVLNGVTLTAKTSVTNAATQFTVANAGVSLAALINASSTAGIGGKISATGSGLTATISGLLTKFTPPATPSHCLCAATTSAVTITGSFTSFSYTVAALTTQYLRAITAPKAPFVVTANITGGSVADSLKNTVGIATPWTLTTQDGVSFTPGASPVNTVQAVPVGISEVTSASWGDVGYAYQLGGESLDYTYNAQLTFLVGGMLAPTAPLPIISIVCPDLTGLSVGDT